jgi:hypothetical protein
MGGVPLDDAILEKIYYDAENPASYGGVAKLARAARLPLKTTRQWLMTQDAYTLHKPIRFNFERRKVLSYGIGELMQCDLVDMSKLSKYNNGVKYLLTAIDVFSKRGYAIPLKSKNADSVLEGLKKLFKESNFVTNLQTDEGKEFYNKKVGDYFRRHKINHYSSHSEHKASVVERFNRTLKSKLYRIFTHTNSHRYVDVLKSVLKSYNASVHRSTGLAPTDVTPELEEKIFEKLYGYNIIPRYKFRVNDQVRISKARRAFRKGYLPNWTEEVFVIYRRYPSSPPTYLIKDLKGSIVKGRFYEQELQKVVKTSRDFWRVEKILKTRGVGAKKEYFVKWKGFDRHFNSWVKASWMK